MAFHPPAHPYLAGIDDDVQGLASTDEGAKDSSSLSLHDAKKDKPIANKPPNNKSFFFMLQLILEFQKDNYVKNKKLIR